MRSEPKVSNHHPIYKRKIYPGYSPRLEIQLSKWECIVMDSDSTDNSAAAVVQEMAGR